MKRNIVFISALVSVVLLTVGLPVAGQAGTSDNSKTTRDKSGSRPMIAKNSVVVNGTISGSLQGRIKIGGRDVEITDQTRIYKNGKGSIDRGTYVVKAPVYVVGTMRDGKIYAVMVVVSDSRTNDTGGKVRKLSPDEPL
jgi:hypothetical protein